MTLKRSVITAGILMALFAFSTTAFMQDSTDEAPTEAVETDTPEAEATMTRLPQATPRIPTAAVVELEAVVMSADEARLTVCSAPVQPGFTPHIVRSGERMADLLANVPTINVTQLAALNCVDDPNSLPVGSVVWLPASAQMIADGAYFPEDSDPDVDRAGILSFEPSTAAPLNQEGLTFSWDAVGTAAYFYACPNAAPQTDDSEAEAECARPLGALPLPMTFTTPTIGNFLYDGPYRYRLEVVDGDASETQDATIEVVCSQRSLAPSEGVSLCPQNPPLAIFGAWSPFEGGVMMWFSDTREIYVMTNEDQRVQVYIDPFMEGMDNPDDDAPSGLMTPTRGFGQVWQALGGAEESGLGWAMAQEIGFDSARQAAGRQSYTTYIQGPGANVYAVTLIPGTNEGLWTQVAG